MQVGTVLNVKDAKNAVEAGAKFLMSPTMVKVSIHLLLLICRSDLYMHMLKPLYPFFMFSFSIVIFRY